MKHFKRIPLHPILFSLYPVIALMAFNRQEMHLAAGGRSIVMSLLLAITLFAVFRLLLRDWSRASLVTTFTLLLFYTYGHAYLYLEQNSVFGLNLGRHRVLLIIWLGVYAAGCRLLLKQVRDMQQINRALNVISGILLALPVVQLANFQIASATSRPQDEFIIAETEIEGLTLPETPRDVYFIILDEYARDDVLLDIYGFDNSHFLDELEARGFYVPRCARSNYVKTRLSLTSSLNLDYLEPLGITSNEKDRLANELIRNSKVKRIFEALGYKTVAFETGFPWTEWADVDIYFARGTQELNTLIGGMNNFELIFFGTTLGQAVYDLSLSLLKEEIDDEATTQMLFLDRNTRLVRYETVNYVLDSLATVPSIPGNKFIFAHILTPHFPFIFGSEGEFLPQEPEDFFAGYADQITHTNKRILEIVDQILAASASEPVIILQSDHGGPRVQGTEDRLDIFSAYYLPDGGAEKLHQAFTPVNNFRLVLDTYFGTDYGLLDDVSRLSTSENFFDFSFPPDDRPGCEP